MRGDTNEWCAVMTKEALLAQIRRRAKEASEAGATLEEVLEAAKAGLADEAAEATMRS